MKTLSRRLALVSAVLTLTLTTLLLFGGIPAARADDATVKLTVRVTDTGWVPDTIEVPQGALVELTFVWDNPNHPNDEHIIVIPDYKLESDKINSVNKQTVLKFIADKAGSFNFKCDFECDTHDAFQHGTIKVVAGSGGSAGTGASAASFQASKIVIDPVAGVAINGNSVSISATLQDKDGKPIPKAEVLFFAHRQFLGRHGDVAIAAGKTDAGGNVYATYRPTNSDGGEIILRFEGGGVFAKTEQTFNLAGSPQFEPIPAFVTDDGLHGIKGFAPFVLVAVIGSVWLAFAFMLFQAWGVSRVRSEGSQSK
ncbi:MAG: cupredoxin domain-containing protein [Anaerolineaceae bacterium]